jgi:glutaredoxin
MCVLKTTNTLQKKLFYTQIKKNPMSLHCQLYTVSGVKCGTSFQGKIVLCTKHEESIKPRYICEEGVCRLINNSEQVEKKIATIFTTNPKKAVYVETRLQELGLDVIIKHLDIIEMKSQFGIDCPDLEVFIGDRYIDNLDEILETTNDSKEATIFSPSQFHCPYCDDANDLLLKHGYYVRREELTDQELADKFGVSFTVPKIYIGNTFVGGFSDLKKFLKM